MSDIPHALTIDVEDWFHVCGLRQEPVIPRPQWRVRALTEQLLALLAACQTRATFFMLGSVAEAEPGLAPMIAAQGHEIASHGWSHRLVHDLTAQEFQHELERTEQLLYMQTGIRPVGYRAPRWSLSRRTPWAHDILAAGGYLYDSSCNPLPLVGNARSPRCPYVITTEHGSLWEIPPMVTPTVLGNLPTGGGWGFRLFPPALLSATMARYQRERHPAVLYLHPREIDPDGPRLPLSLFGSFAAYGTRRDATPRLSKLLRRFRFTTLRELVGTWQPAS